MENCDAGLVVESVKVLPFNGDLTKQKFLYEYKSKPLKDIVFQMLKFSKNNYAETLVRTLGHEVGTGGSQADGVSVLNDFFAEIGLDEGEVSAFDGSGLSPSTRVTGEAILKLFDFVDQQSWKDIFWNSLPESQKDGTLKYRFDTAGLKHQVLGKTGTHEFSSSLSGKILKDVDGGKNILFSIHVYNHPFTTEESVVRVRPIIDKIVALLDQQF
ncbi:D-alanyl-D-alanine carboxypeptidase [Candidatus Peregrinibacteria bacterium]|nr:D-alanyl-D-alanine carboxypeptidase [Candidatus Peregrinibacteria bacterium]